CHRCGREIDRFHGSDRALRLRHLPVFGREVLIEIRPKRYRCPHCDGGPTTTQRCDWYDPNRPHTKAFEAWVLKLLVHSTVADVSRRLDLGVKAVEGIMAYHLTPTVDWAAFTVLETLGIDEVALCKGQGHYMAVVWARDAVGDTHVLAVLPNRLQATVQAFLDTIPAALKTTVRQVCIDMWEGYASAVAATLPAAEVVVDRFHVAVQYRQAVDDLRQQECRRLNAGRPADQVLPTAELRSLLRREGSSLNRAQQDQLVNLFQPAPTLASAYRLRTLLTAIFECTPDRVTAQTRLHRWGEQVKAAGITCFDKFLTTLQHWQEGILNYFNNRQNSGFVEGLNNKLKLLQRRCFGLDDPTKLFQRLWLDIEGARQWF
ncbi:MAG TPA: ISL3 family transposase, partial [Candidatus Competibacteraceae bacterium]|nr:ISL3 family transposase [Candidatus Competibacteraceae bacterium]